MFRLLLTLLAAGLSILSFPPFHWHPLALVAAIPLIAALHGTSPAKALGLGLLFGLSLFAGTLNWLAFIFGPMAVLLFVMLALFPTFFAATLASLQKVAGTRTWLPFAVGTIWTGLEYFRSEWFTLRFPWITPGTGLPPGYLTPFIGVYGMSFIVVTGASALVMKRPKLGAALLTVAALATYLPLPKPSPQGPTIAAVQAEMVGFGTYLELSRQAEGSIDAFVWPEYAVTPDVRENADQVKAIQKLLADTGARQLTLGSRTDHDDGSWNNTAVTLGLDGVLGTHDKNRPVHFFDDGEPGTEVPAFETPLGTISTTICFDNDYASIARRGTANGAELFLIPSMDAESWSARQHLQHAELARHRAAENGRWMVVASSSGLTQVIDPRGQRVSSLPLFDPGVLVARVDLLSHRTIYNLVGWLIGPLCVAATAALLVFTSVLTRRQAKAGTVAE